MNCLGANGNEYEEQRRRVLSALIWSHATGCKLLIIITIRKQFAGVGYTYDLDKDVFVAPQPYPSWSLDDNSDWQAPTPMPEDDNMYSWNEDTQSWDLVEPVTDETE